MARQVQEDNPEPKGAVPATEQDLASSSDDEISAADKALAKLGYAPVSARSLHSSDLLQQNN